MSEELESLRQQLQTCKEGIIRLSQFALMIELSSMRSDRDKLQDAAGMLEKMKLAQTSTEEENTALLEDIEVR
jgi:hypothetical protein